TLGGTASPGLDYGATNGLLAFADGELVKTFSVPIFDDTLVEGPETILLALSNPTGAVLGQGTGTLTILADEAVFNFSATNYVVSESNIVATIFVTRSPQGTGPVSVDFST